MRDLRRYWQEIRALQSSLPEFVWLASVEKDARAQAEDSVVEVPAARAAQLLHARSHRLAADDEVRLYRVREETSRNGMDVSELRRQGVAVVSVVREP